jgi:hypothetical protein
MKLFGSIKELVSAVFRKDGQEVTVRPNQTTTYTAARDVQLPPGDAAHVLTSATSTQTLTNKTIDGDDNTVQDLPLTSLKTVLGDADEALVRDASGAVVSAKILNVNIDAAAAIAATKIADGSVDNTEFQKLGTAGTNSAGELVTTDGTQTLTNKTLTSPSISTPTGLVKGDVGLGNVDNTSDATKNAATATLTNKTIDGDDNTVQDLPLTSLKTQLADANKVIRRDASGIVVSGNAIPNSSSLVTTDAAQVITEKDIDGGTASNTSRVTLPKAGTTTLDALTRKQGTLVYDTDLNKVKYDDGSQLNVVGSGSGSGSGSINYILNPDAEANTAGWATYADAAGAIPVDGTGGTANITLTRSISVPLRGTASFLLTKDSANRQGQGISYDFSIDSADISKTLQISLDLDAAVANYAADDLRVYIYDVTNATLITPAQVSIAAAKYQFQTTFVASTSTSYRLIVHVASTNASAYSVKLDNVVVGPQVLTLGSPETDWQSYSLTVDASTTAPTLGTVVVNQARWARKGSNMLITYTLSQSTAGTTGTGVYRFPLPAGYTIDSSVANIDANGTNSTNFGNAWMNRAGGPLDAAGYVVPLTSTTLGVIVDGTADPIGSTSQGAFNAALQLKFLAIVPIAEWAGSGVYLGTAQPEYAFSTATTTTAGASDLTSFGYGPQGINFRAINSTTDGAFTTYRVRFLTPIQPTDKIELQMSRDRQSWPVVGAEPLVETGSRQNIKVYGMSWVRVTGSTTDVDVIFYNNGARADGPTFAANGGLWSDLTPFWWRAVKIPGQVQVATPTLPAPTAMSDVVATQQGHKTYVHGTSYNGGNAPTVTGQAGFAADVTAFIPYQMQDGKWRLRFNVRFGQTSSTTADITIAGVTFTSISPVAVTANNSAVLSYVGRTTSGTGSIVIRSSSADTQFSVSGDVELTGKPTWAY